MKNEELKNLEMEKPSESVKFKTRNKVQNNKIMWDRLSSEPTKTFAIEW